MSAIEFTDKEMTYLLLALKKYEAQLLAFDEEDMEDRTTDLIFVQALQQKVKDSKSGK